jgi:hypothetical protein
MSPLEKKRTVVTLRSDGYEVVVEGTLLTTPQNNVIILPSNRLADAIAKEWDIFLFEREAREQRHQFHQKLKKNHEANKEISINTMEVFKNPGAGFSIGKVETYSYQTLPPLTHLAALAIDWSATDPSFIFPHFLEVSQSDPLLNSPSSAIPGFYREIVAPLQEWYQGHYGSSLEDSLRKINYWALTTLYKLTQVTGSLLIPLALFAGKIDPTMAFTLAESTGWFKDATLMENMTIAQKRLFLRTQLIVCSRFLSLSKGDQGHLDFSQVRVVGSIVAKAPSL